MIEYNELSQKDRLLFAHSGLDRLIRISGNILEKRIGKIETIRIDRPYFSEASLAVVNDLIIDILELIGRHSNKRFGATAKQQNNFFIKPGERQTFPIHLYISRCENKVEQLKNKNEKTKAIILKNSDKYPSYSKKIFEGITTAHKITFGKNKLTESETRAVGVFYMVNLVYKTILESQKIIESKMPEAVSLSTIILSGFDLFSLLDQSDLLATYSDAGKSGNKKKQYEEAEKIIENIVKENPEKATNILVKEAKYKIEAEYCGDRSPKDDWITKNVRLFKKSLVRN